MFRKSSFWVLFAIGFMGCVGFAYKYFPRAYPIVNLRVTMDRGAAMASAAQLARKFRWEPQDFRQAASFQLDQSVQNFVELEAGGREGFSRMLQQGNYSPYTWQVRHFQQHQIKTTRIFSAYY